MLRRAKAVWLTASGSLGFVPGIIVALFGILGIVLVEVDGQLDLEGVRFVFTGDGSAARTVLSVIAGSLITVAGLTFSITMVVLQLASSQFSPRILRTFFGDRITQITIGAYVGTFVYSILVLRAVGAYGDTGFVPRLSVTVASLLGIGGAVLLIVFLHHVSRMIQASHVAARIAHDTLVRIDALYPEGYGEPAAEEDADELLAAWREAMSGDVLPQRPGYVRRVDLEGVLERLRDDGVERVAMLVCPGDFVSVDTPIATVWPREATERAAARLLRATTVADERDLDQDVDFGLRQLTDIALKAMSPGINDPMTAVTCIGYVRSILVRLAERSDPAAVRYDHDLTLILRRRRFDERLEALTQIGRYVDGDAWVAGELLQGACACAVASARAGAPERLRGAQDVALAIAEQSRARAGTARDRERIDRLLAAATAVGA